MAKNTCVMLFSELPSSAITLQALHRVPAVPSLDAHFVMRFSGIDKGFQVISDESAAIKSIYEDQLFYEQLGKELCLAIGIALAKGGP